MVEYSHGAILIQIKTTLDMMITNRSVLDQNNNEAIYKEHRYQVSVLGYEVVAVIDLGHMYMEVWLGD